MTDYLILPILFFLIAALYSTVGHAGASGYLATMALVGLAPAVMRPTALLLNILVAIIGAIRFHRAGCINWQMFLPFAITSIPCAVIGGLITLPNPIYRKLVGLVLLYAAVRLFIQTISQSSAPPRKCPLAASLPIGGAIGLISGLTGVGGGIFLSPVLMLMRWADPRHTAGIAAAFILVNSIAGLIGSLTAMPGLPLAIILWAAAAGAGGLIGAQLGARKLAGPTIRTLLACVLVVAAIKMLMT